MKSKIRHLRSILDSKKGKAEQIESYIEQKKKKRRFTQRSLKLNEKAQVVVNEVSRLTKESLRYHLSDICSMAMASVFSDPYEIQIDFTEKRGKIEADVWFVKDGNLISPFMSTGGGAVDISALSLRFSCWTIQNPKTRPILILDEPLRFLKGEDLPYKGAEMIHQISEKLGLQIIMVSHDPELIDCADNIISVDIKNGISKVEGGNVRF
jgi:DNA repair exonuclease SbcCD ATPase subunit